MHATSNLKKTHHDVEFGTMAHCLIVAINHQSIHTEHLPADQSRKLAVSIVEKPETP
jgi:hypothetical protein